MLTKSIKGDALAFARDTMLVTSNFGIILNHMYLGAFRYYNICSLILISISSLY
jgi:hypothetical protein